jgi:MFS family permease
MSGSKTVVGLLVALQALLLTNNVGFVLLAAPIAFSLAPDPALATTPLTVFVIGAAATAMPISLLMKRMGRVFGFRFGAVVGFLGAALSAFALIEESFELFLFASLFAGSFSATGQYYRFAAAEAVPDSRRSRAISYVLAGGLIGAFLGPQTAVLTDDLLPVRYLATYFALMSFAVLSFVLAGFLRLPEISAAERASETPPRPFGEILATPGIRVAILGAITGYAVMNFLMTSTSLAMTMHHHSGADAAFVIEWHVVGMFAPSFFTGGLVQRFGAFPIMRWGAALMIAAVIAATAGTSVTLFWTALFLLGVGWNFLYIGGTQLLSASHLPSERGKVQGFNEMLIFVGTGTSSLLSGALLHFAGWQAMVLFTLPLLLLTLVVLHRAGRHTRTASAIA